MAESLTISVTSHIQKPIEANSKGCKPLIKYVRDVSNKIFCFKTKSCKDLYYRQMRSSQIANSIGTESVFQQFLMHFCRVGTQAKNAFKVFDP